MAPSSRDRISVDLRGLKAALLEGARARGVSPSEFVRAALLQALGLSAPMGSDRHARAVSIPIEGRVRLSLRMSREDVLATRAAARNSGLSPGAFIAGLVADVPALSSGGSRTDHLAALIASSAELSTLSRNIHHLTSLLRQGAVRPALEYRAMLDTLAGDVRGHLKLASSVLADLRPRRRGSEPSKHPPS
jgi:hypothetical protein